MKSLWFLPPPIISEFVVSVGSPIHKQYKKFGISSLSSLPETECYPESIRSALGPLLSFHAGFSYTLTDNDTDSIDHTGLVDAVRKWWDCARASSTCRMFRGPSFIDIEYKVGDLARHLHIDDVH